MIAIVCALVGCMPVTVFAAFLLITESRDKALDRQAHAAELAARDEKIGQLIDQVQLNSQSMPYYPTLGPAPAEGPEPRLLTDQWGYAVFEDLEDSDLADVAGD